MTLPQLQPRTSDKRLCKLTDENLANHRSMQAAHCRSYDHFYTQALLVNLHRMSRVTLVEVVSLKYGIDSPAERYQ